MPLDGPGCGVRNHTPDCLCDVHVTNPVSVMDNWATESFLIRRLVEEMGPDTLHHQASLLELLVRQVDIYDCLVSYNNENEITGCARLFDDSHLTGGMRMAIRQMDSAGIKTKKIRKYLSERYGVETTADEVHNIIDSHRRTNRKRNRK